MKIQDLLVSALAAGAMVCAGAPALADPAMATLSQGAVRGALADGVVAFKGVPYAAAPVGPLRWRAPQAAPSWTGTRQALQYGPDCMQEPFPGDYAPLGVTPAEDCLYANVWRPVAASKPLPVMVWIYGGGFVNGGASPPTYSGAALAKQGILVFSFNYRLGRFGTFAHPGLTAADADQGLLANYGYLDQIAALKWVKANIAAFGGDPDNVTVVGESAGGMSINALITSPLGKGLFQRAVIQSGGPSSLGDPSLKGAEATGLAFARSQGLADGDPDAVAKLRALSAEQVTDHLNMAALFTPQAGPKTFSSPIADGKIAVDALAAYHAGAYAHVPVMIGATADDIGGKDGFMVQGAREVAKVVSAGGQPAYYYRYSYVATSARETFKNGAGHATEVPFFFNTEAARYGDKTSAQDHQAAKLVSAYLVNFVKSGDPNGPGLPRWTPYAAAKPTLLDFTADASAKPVLDQTAPSH